MSFRFLFYIFCSFFFFFFFFLNLHLRSQNTLSFCFSAPALHLFFQKAGVSAKRRYFILVSFVVLKQTPTLKKKNKNKSLLLFSSLITWTPVDLADDLWVLPCLGAISIVHIPQAWPIHPWIYRHTFPAWEPDAVCGRCGRRVQLLDAAASCRLQTRNSAFSPGSPLYFPNGTFSDISQAATVRKYTAETTRSTPISQRQKKKKPLKTLHSIWIPSEPLVLKYDSLTLATRHDGDGESAVFHNDSHIISHKSRHES